jgi:hypothetical protein
MKNAIVLLLGLVLAGCSSVELDEDQVSAIHRVAIVSTVGDELSVVEIPLFPILVEDDFGPFAQYGLDAFVVKSITAKLGSRYQVVPFKDPVHITRGDKADWWWHDDNYTHIDLPPDGDTGKGKVDTYILITPGTGTVYGTSHQVHGAFVAHHPNMGNENGVGVTYHIIVVDAKTGKRIKNVQTIAGEDSDASLWPETEKFADLSDAQKKAIEAKIETAMDRSLDYALREMGLLPEE